MKLKATPLTEAFAEYRAELNLCQCDTCQRVDSSAQHRRRWNSLHLSTEVAYWSAVSDQLREVSEGRHVRREWDDCVAAQPKVPQGKYRHESISNGLGVGVGPALNMYGTGSTYECEELRAA